MPITPDEVIRARYYVTTGGQIWQVTAITDDGQVTYRSRQRPWDPWFFKASASLQAFAAAVDREVSATYDPSQHSRAAPYSGPRASSSFALRRRGLSPL